MHFTITAVCGLVASAAVAFPTSAHKPGGLELEARDIMPAQCEAYGGSDPSRDPTAILNAPPIAPKEKKRHRKFKWAERRHHPVIERRWINMDPGPCDNYLKVLKYLKQEAIAHPIPPGTKWKIQ